MMRPEHQYHVTPLCEYFIGPGVNHTVKILVCNFELQCPSTIASRAAETLLLRASTKL